MSGSLKPGADRFVLLRGNPTGPVNIPVAGSTNVSSSTHEWAVVGATSRANATRAFVVDERILICEISVKS